MFLKNIIQRRIPGQLVIQLTDQCNARCPQCGMRVTEPFERSKLASEEVKRILDAAAQKGIQAVSFTGGEPLLMLDELTMLMDYAGGAGIKYIRTGTNGFVFGHPNSDRFEKKVNRIAEKLAATPLRNFWISIDSAIPSVHEDMRGFPGIIAGIEKALPILHSHGIYPSANLGVNRNILGDPIRRLKAQPLSEEGYLESFYLRFREAFRQFYRFILELGFTMSSTCYPMSIGDEATQELSAVYGATAENDVVHFDQKEKSLLFKVLIEIIPEFRKRLRIFSPLSSVYSLYRQYHDDPSFPYACRGGIDFFFINAKDGNTYPCGYRGKENLGTFSGMDHMGLDSGRGCTLCDWECFRDPSELFGPIMHGMKKPWSLFKKYRSAPDYFRLWTDDLRYFKACRFFDGRIPPDYFSMRRAVSTADST